MCIFVLQSKLKTKSASSASSGLDKNRDGGGGVDLEDVAMQAVFDLQVSTTL